LDPKFYAQSLHYLGQSQQMGIGRFILFFPLGCVGGGCGQMVPVVLARKDFPNLLYLTGYDPVAAVDVYALGPACFMGTTLTSCITDEVLLLASDFSRNFLFVAKAAIIHMQM
jgi:hypothetical protein